MAKQDLPNVRTATTDPNNKSNELSVYQTLFSKKDRTITGTYSFTSSSSGIAYSTADAKYSGDSSIVNKGEEGGLNLLAKYELKDYLITALDFNSVDALRTVPTATGTGTALVVSKTGFALVDGALIDFVASANNGGSATTINGNSTGAKSLYKENTISAPTLTSGRAYRARYKLSSDCFFLLASAAGNVVPAHVLETDRFSGDGYYDEAGTMPNNGSQSATLDTSTTSKVIPAGYTTGGTVDIVTETKTVTPSDSSQNITPTAGKVLSQVTVEAISSSYKKYATGTITSSASNSNFADKSGSFGLYFPTITVNTLTFTPKTIKVYRESNDIETVYTYEYMNSTDQVKIIVRETFVRPNSPVSIGTTFVLPVNSANTSYTWKAFEE